MPTGLTPGPKDAMPVSFGPFKLIAGERLLLRDSESVEIGGRTLDTLIALVSRPNETISKHELMALVWPDVTVEEGSLRFHIAALRKTLGDGVDGARYISTLAGRGYCFVAQVSGSGDRGETAKQAAPSLSRDQFLPSRLARMVGRADGLRSLSTHLTAERFVTIVGAGGVGKTTLAVAVANDLTAAFEGAVLFVDLGALNDPSLATTSLASMLGLSVQADDPTPSVIAYLRDKAVLLVFDNCEHLIDAAASLAARIFAAAPQVHILATSREALRVEGEHVYRLDPLDCPPDDPNLTAEVALRFPAIQLFVERAAASGAELTLSDADAVVASSICRKLDGIALAIELAAGRVGSYGLQQTAALLDERLSLIWRGQRGAPARQQTLRATLDWSYSLLSETERQVLRRLAVFTGDFTLEAARAVLANENADQQLILDSIDSLVAKSMVATSRIGDTMRYRLLETTRAYALEVSVETEVADAGARHAVHYRQWLMGSKWQSLPNAAERSAHLADVGNVRAALEWCFGAHGNVQLGIELATAAAPVFVAMSLFIECRRWSERAIAALDDAHRGARDEMHLQATLGVSLMFLKGQSEAALSALERSLAIAKFRGDAVTELQVTAPIIMYHLRIGDFRTALAYGKGGSAISKTIADSNALALAHSLLGISLTHTGDLTAARVELEAAQRVAGSRRESATYLGFDGHDLAGVFLARTLWLQGYPDQAVKRAHLTLDHAAAVDHPVTLSIALVWAVTVFLWVGDLDTAEEHINWFIARAQTHSLGPYLAVGRGCKGQLAIRRGDPERGVEDIRSALTDLHAVRYELLTTTFTISLVQGLTALGRFDEALTILDEAIEMVKTNGDASYMPELLRVKANVFLAMHGADHDAQTQFAQSLELARNQGALGWELRTAIDLAAVWAREQPAQSRDLLRPIFDRFQEGQETPDLRAARQLLAELN